MPLRRRNDIVALVGALGQSREPLPLAQEPLAIGRRDGQVTNSQVDFGMQQRHVVRVLQRLRIVNGIEHERRGRAGRRQETCLARGGLYTRVRASFESCR